MNDTDGVMKIFGTYDVSRLKSTHMQEHGTSNGPACDPMAEKFISSFRFD